jgi:mxaL protein
MAELVGVNYRRLTTPEALKTAMLDRRYAQYLPADTDLRWIPALLALALLAWRFAPELGLMRATGRSREIRSATRVRAVAGGLNPPGSQGRRPSQGR